VKTTPYFRLSLWFAILVTAGSALLAEEAAEPDSSQPRLKEPIHAMVPFSLLNVPMQEPKAVARIQVNSRGEVDDLVILSATHVELANRADRLLRDARFVTDHLAEGEAIRFEISLSFLYPSQMGLQIKTAMDDVETMVADVQSRDFRVRTFPPAELDAPPQLLDRGEVFVPETGVGDRIEGRAIVEFHINHLGEVRMPQVVEASHPEVARAAVATVSDMTFSPPRHEGRPAVTKVRMPFETFHSPPE